MQLVSVYSLLFLHIVMSFICVSNFYILQRQFITFIKKHIVFLCSRKNNGHFILRFEEHLHSHPAYLLQSSLEHTFWLAGAGSHFCAIIIHPISTVASLSRPTI